MNLRNLLRNPRNLLYLLSLVAIYSCRWLHDAPRASIERKFTFIYFRLCNRINLSKNPQGAVVLAALGLSPATLSRVPSSLLWGGRYLTFAFVAKR